MNVVMHDFRIQTIKKPVYYNVESFINIKTTEYLFKMGYLLIVDIPYLQGKKNWFSI